MTEYHKIETLYERDEATHKVRPGALKNRTYGLLKTWHWTEKVDGTNVRILWDPANAASPLSFGGRTDAAQLHADLVRWLYQAVKPTALAAVFPDTPAVVYAEGYGAGIQRGGGYRATKAAIVFDVLVSGTWWLSDENMRDVAAKLGLDAVPSFGEMSLDDATELVRKGLPSRVPGCAEGSIVHPVDPRLEIEATPGALAASAAFPAEGLVGRPAETLFDKKGARLIVKLKTKDFA